MEWGGDQQTQDVYHQSLDLLRKSWEFYQQTPGELHWQQQELGPEKAQIEATTEHMYAGYICSSLRKDLSIYLSIHLSIYLSICIYIYMYI